MSKYFECEFVRRSQDPYKKTETLETQLEIPSLCNVVLSKVCSPESTRYFLDLEGAIKATVGPSSRKSSYVEAQKGLPRKLELLIDGDECISLELEPDNDKPRAFDSSHAEGGIGLVVNEPSSTTLQRFRMFSPLTLAEVRKLSNAGSVAIRRTSEMEAVELPQHECAAVLELFRFFYAAIIEPNFAEAQAIYDRWMEPQRAKERSIEKRKTFVKHLFRGVAGLAVVLVTAGYLYKSDNATNQTKLDRWQAKYSKPEDMNDLSYITQSFSADCANQTRNAEDDLKGVVKYYSVKCLYQSPEFLTFGRSIEWLSNRNFQDKKRRLSKKVTQETFTQYALIDSYNPSHEVTVYFDKADRLVGYKGTLTSSFAVTGGLQYSQVRLLERCAEFATPNLINLTEGNNREIVCKNSNYQTRVWFDPSDDFVNITMAINGFEIPS